MARLGTFPSVGSVAHGRIGDWNDLACPCGSQASALHPARAVVGGLWLAEVCAGEGVIRHPRMQALRSRDRLFFLDLQLEGESLYRQDGREARLRPGDFTLCDGTRPCEMTLGESNRRLTVGIPDAMLRRHLAWPESVVAVRMSGQHGAGSLVRTFLVGFWRACREEIDAASELRVVSALLDLIAGVYSTVPRAGAERSSLATAHRVRIMGFIESHLRDPDLTPARIAQACRITTRYLHHLFSSESETVTRYILRRRLEECAREMLVAAPSGRTVTDIAFEYGFNSLTHFGRVFREHYGVTPSEYRRRRSGQTCKPLQG